MTTLVYRVNSKIRRRVEPRLHDFSDCDCETDTCEALKAQNDVRCSTDCSMPVWDDDLAAKARRKARLLAQDDSLNRGFVHLGKRSNIYIAAHHPSIEDAVNAWVAEEEMRNESSNGQVPDDLCMWHRTRRFGMGKAVSNSGYTYIVARYMPQGRR